MSDKKMRIAVVELNPRHDELFPTWLHLANRKDYCIDFFVSPMHEARDIFSVSESPKPKCFLTSSPDLGDSIFMKILKRIYTNILRLRSLLLLRIRYDLVIANSVERENNYWHFFHYLNKPMLAVLHNSNLLVANKAFNHLRGKRSISVLVLSKHIQAYLAQHEIASYPVYAISGLRKAFRGGRANEELTFCVQGNIDFHRRNYDSLLKAASQLKKEKVRCNFRMVGGFNRSASIMQSRIAELGISDYFTFVSDAESYQDYYKAICDCRFLLFLIDDTRMIYRPFFEDKCTSSLIVALALGVIPVVNNGLANTYGIAGCSVLYEADDVYSGIRSALSFESKRVDSLANSLEQVRQQLAEISDNEFDKAITSAIDR